MEARQHTEMLHFVLPLNLLTSSDAVVCDPRGQASIISKIVDGALVQIDLLPPPTPYLRSLSVQEERRQSRCYCY